jgi:hypothetical protein
VLCIHNISNQPQQLEAGTLSGLFKDILSEEKLTLKETLTLAPYEIRWLLQRPQA